MSTFTIIVLLFLFLPLIGAAFIGIWVATTDEGKEWSEKNKKEQDAKFKKSMSDYEKDLKIKKTQLSKIVCKFCGKTGKISKKKVTLKEENREKGIIGATIGRKTVTKKQATQLTCKNCGMEWTL